MTKQEVEEICKAVINEFADNMTRTDPYTAAERSLNEALRIAKFQNFGNKERVEELEKTKTPYGDLNWFKEYGILSAYCAGLKNRIKELKKEIECEEYLKKGALLLASKLEAELYDLKKEKFLNVGNI